MILLKFDHLLRSPLHSIDKGPPSHFAKGSSKTPAFQIITTPFYDFFPNYRNAMDQYSPIIRLQILQVKGHSKNKFSLLSTQFLQKGRAQSPVKLQESIFGSQFVFRVSQPIKACLGIAPGNQISFHPMKHGCVSGLGCGCGTWQFLKNVGAGAAGLGD